MPSARLETCLATRPEKRDPDAVASWCRRWAEPLARDGDAVLELARRVALDTGWAEMEGELLSSVLDTARMNRENREAGADRVLAGLESGLAADLAELGANARMRLCAAYARAGMEPPGFLRIGGGEGPPGSVSEAGPDDMPDIAAILDEILPDDAGGLQAHMVLSEALAAMEDGPAELFVRMMIASGEAKSVAVGRYFLLDPRSALRRAAGAGFRDLARSGGIDGAGLSALIAVRTWMPDDAAAEGLDEAIREALAREAGGGAVPRAWKLHRVVTTLPDGTGSQSVMASASRGSEKGVAALLLKAGHGVKDAYVIPAGSASEQRHIMQRVAEEIPCEEVPAAAVRPWVALALGDGLEAGRPPAPGLIDVAPMLGASDVTPAEVSPDAWLALADPEGTVAAMSATKRGRLIGRSRDWPMLHEIADSWFLSDAELMESLAEAKSERAARAAVWRRLEALRADWTLIFARCAAILRRAEHAEDAWQSFAAVSLALEEGRALKKVPICEFIVDQTLDAAEDAMAGAMQDFDEDEDEDPDFDAPVIAPEGKGELARLLKGTGLTGAAIDGFLTGILIAPEFVTPGDWLPPLMQDLELKGEGSIQRLLDILMLRYEEINARIHAGEIGTALRALPTRDFGPWLAGLAMATRLAPAWPTRRLSNDDRKVLRLISEAERDASAAETVRPLLPAWLDGLARRTQ